ncbi:Modification methylase HphIA [Cyphellophora attinorum]|uniref:DNA (cytosine-5-)-methyltransferase n=1 Tax=Cyphellophora attinorum TaxID=1664694 RepID=A0A0N1HVW4_9EURO|nr:Modification methylase HphIA [Phialophora attinorum]KPI41560.1 Modification methylase HphIA [Phialophora attinorum]
MGPNTKKDSFNDDENAILHRPTPMKRVANVGHYFNKVVRRPLAEKPLAGKRLRDDAVDFRAVPTTIKRQKNVEEGRTVKEPIEVEEEAGIPPLAPHSTQTAGVPGSAPGEGAIEIMDFETEDFMTDAQLRSHLRKLSLEQTKKDALKLKERTSMALYQSHNPPFRCASGQSVELADGSFLRIMEVLRDGHGKVFLTGQKFVRQSSVGSWMRKNRNELVLIRKIPLTTGELDPWKFVDEVTIGEVRRNRKIILTNQSFPSISIREDAKAFATAQEDIELGPLFCRWAYTTYVNERRQSVEYILERLNHDNADNTVRPTSNSATAKPTRVRHSEIRAAWRNCDTSMGGSHYEVQHSTNFDGSAQSSRVQTYTFGDAFCGAGGTSRGAVDAGLKPLWGFDLCPSAMQSYRRNFGHHGVDCRGESVQEFISNHLLRLVEFDGVQVDILHISPPCQPFSPAHTIPSFERDEANQAALPSIWHLVELLKPRVVTIEETEGLYSRHKEWLHLIINTFACHGYSVRWKLLHCQHYGVPQNRKRLLIIAAGPGETLPPFPEPTHGVEGTRLKPLATINSTIGNIPANAEDHDVDVKFATNEPKAPFDGNTHARCVTTNAGQYNYHPSGKRPYTIRELARLQTFPLYHSFAGAKGITEKKRQVGNAVPPILAKVVFKSIVKSLKDSDAKEANERQV